MIKVTKEISLIFPPKLTQPTARSLCDSRATCLFVKTLEKNVKTVKNVARIKRKNVVTSVRYYVKCRFYVNERK